MSARPFDKTGLLARALALSTLVSVGLYLYADLFKSGSYYFYLDWNLFLAMLPLLFASLLVRLLRQQAWSSWPGIGLSVLWLGFLPNSFYMVTDYIHLPEVGNADLLFYVVLFTSFIATGLFFGFASLVMVHRELRRRLPAPSARRVVGLVLLLCSFAIYLGRDLRWNTWDVVFNPGGLLFDISERFLNPQGYGNMIETTLLFMVLLSSMYFVIWSCVRVMAGPITSVKSAILENNERQISAGNRRRS